jgi:hypothetical protein
MGGTQMRQSIDIKVYSENTFPGESFLAALHLRGLAYGQVHPGRLQSSRRASSGDINTKPWGGHTRPKWLTRRRQDAKGLECFRQPEELSYRIDHRKLSPGKVLLAPADE